MSGLITLSALAGMPKTIILLLVVVAFVAIFLVGHLLNSYPLVIVASVVTIGLSIFSFIDGMYVLGACWLIYSLVATVAAFLHFYVNMRGAFWWTLGALLAMITSAVPFNGTATSEEGALNVVALVASVIVLLFFGIVGGIFVPRLRFRDKNERKHSTNTDPIIGQRVKIVEDKKNGFPARAVLGDIDWSIEPFYAYETFKVGDIVKVVKIKGVTLLCTRDQKDFRAELKKQRQEQLMARKLEQRELAAKREAIKASVKIQKQKDKLNKEKEKFEQEKAARKAEQARAEAKEKQEEALRKAKEETLAVKKAAKQAKKEQAEKAKAKKAARKAAEKAKALKAKKEKILKAKKAKLLKAKENKKAKVEKKPEAEKVAKAKKEAPVKETKAQVVVKENKAHEEPYKLLYIIASAVVVVLSIAIIVMSAIEALASLYAVARFVYLGLVLVYAGVILSFEVAKEDQGKGNEKKAPKAKEVKKAKPAKKEKPVKVAKAKAKKEAPIKEAKVRAIVETIKKEPFGLFYVVSSIVAVILSLAIIVLSAIEAVASLYAVLRFVYFGIVLIYMLVILACEALKRKQVEQKVIVKKAPIAKPVVAKKPQPVAVKKPQPAVVKKPQPVKKEEVVAVPESSSKEKAEFVPFGVRLRNADKELVDAYNELKSEILSYGIKSRVSSTGDSFRLHTKTYVKMVIAGKCLKLYLALNPRDYRDSTYPFDDASKMVAHKETPFVFKIKSGLSVRRAKVLISDVAKKDGLVQGEVIAHNHAKDVE